MSEESFKMWLELFVQYGTKIFSIMVVDAKYLAVLRVKI